MAQRPNVNVVTQYGVEVTKGTAVAASKRFPGLQIDISPELDPKFYRPEGGKFEEIGVQNREWATGTFNGPLTYGEFPILASSYVNYAAPSTTSGVTTWTNNPNHTTADTLKSFTVERGDATGAGISTGVQVTAMKINIDRMGATMSGNVIGKKIDYTGSLTATPTTVENKPISMNVVSVYLDSTFGAIGTTKLTDVFDIDIDLPDKVDESWVLDSAQTSWKELIEKAYFPKLTVRTEFNAQMQAIYTAMKANTLPTRYLQIKAPGEIISGSDTYEWTPSFALKLENAKEDRKGDSGVYGFTFSFRCVHDATMGRPFGFVTKNATAAL
jgi:hypothetical protein